MLHTSHSVRRLISLNPESKQWTTGDSGKLEHFDYANKFYILWVLEC